MDGDSGLSSASVAAGGLPPNPKPHSRSPWLPEGDSDLDSHPHGRRRGEDREKTLPLSAYPITPDPSVRKVSSGSPFGVMSEQDVEKASLNVGPLGLVSYIQLCGSQNSMIDIFAQRVHYAQYSQTQVVSTAAGVLVLAAAAIAVAD